MSGLYNTGLKGRGIFAKNKQSMKKIISIAMLILCSAIGYCQNKTTTHLNDFKWLIGSWKQINMKPGQSGIETWQVASTSVFTGKGITTQGRDTVFVEKLSLVVKDTAIYYVADVTGNPKPTWFKLTSSTPGSFVCENPEHDFPKKITYNLIGGQIKASISGNDKIVNYTFQKIK